VSALLSGVMLKTAVYGILRVSFDLLHASAWWWGLIPLGIGLFTALYGVVFAAAQTDMKRLLAYSSIENMASCSPARPGGVSRPGMLLVATWPARAALPRANHAFMKSLLFLRQCAQPPRSAAWASSAA
jgi:formate hydrogenlyase subunit 3/multisubunit Na+/H+ antiporter MnhD subunit